METKQSQTSDYEDKWSDAPTRAERPLGITLLAVLEIIGTLISIAIIVAIPIIFGEATTALLGLPLFYLLIAYSAVMIPISFILALGLLKGKEWARFYTKCFQIINIVSSLIRLNILGVIRPVFIFSYLGKPNVTEFFDKKSPLNSRFWYLSILGVVALLVFSSALSVYSNPMVQWNIQENRAISSRETLLAGTWRNSDGTIALTFRQDHTCTAGKDGTTYNGTWYINEHFYWVELSWTFQDFKLKHPNDPNLYYTIEQAYFIGDTLSLYTMFESPAYYICTKL